MSDNHRRYRAICRALRQCYPGDLSGRMTQHLTILAALISGIVGSKSSQLPSIATKVPDRAKPDSRVQRLSRWLRNDAIKEEVYFLPYAEFLLNQLALETLVLVMDGSCVGRNCCALMIHVLYKGRALPLAWRVRKGAKGHFPEAMHIELIELIAELIPEGTKVVFLGDGEFDGIKLQGTIDQLSWFYVCRTSYDTTAQSDQEPFRLDAMGVHLKIGHVVSLPEILFTSKAYGPVMVICCWAKGNKEPLYLVSNMDSAELACRYYEKRFRIETFFSDQKSRGFHIQKSHLEDPQRLSRLLIANCLAYIWVVYLGSLCETDKWNCITPRRNRQDLSLFQIGLRFLEHILNEGEPIPVQFHVNI